MLIGIPKEIRAGQTLVAATPNTVQKLISLGYTVSVEQGAGDLRIISISNSKKPVPL